MPTLEASGSGMVASSTQSNGFSSDGSLISSGGLTGGSKSSNNDPALTSTVSTCTAYVLSGLMVSVYTCGRASVLMVGAPLRCFSSHSPDTAFWRCKMKCTLLVPPHLSGPNITAYGEFGVRPSGVKPSSWRSTLRYAPPQSSPSVSATSYCSTNSLSAGNSRAPSNGAVNP